MLLVFLMSSFSSVASNSLCLVVSNIVPVAGSSARTFASTLATPSLLVVDERRTRLLKRMQCFNDDANPTSMVGSKRVAQQTCYVTASQAARTGVVTRLRMVQRRFGSS